MTDPITRFSGSYDFLSNFYPSRVFIALPLVGGEERPQVCRTVEHGFQAYKTTEPGLRFKIAVAQSPGHAKRLGREVELRYDWEDIKEFVMLDLLRQKFRHAILKDRLLATQDAVLVEGNTWGDRYWGQCPLGTGLNRLGILLMQVREELHESL